MSLDKKYQQTILYNDVGYHIFENLQYKICRSSDQSYNYNFDKQTGDFYRWGKTTKNADDPLFCPLGPEILDLEISINGCSSNCDYCYKKNTNAPPTNMSFDTFKTVLDKMPPVLTQVAFGITDETTNPEMLQMMNYCRKVGVIPNVTINGKQLSEKIADEFKKLLGAIAVSAHPSNKQLCYDTVAKLKDRGMEQVNIHVVVSSESLAFVYELLDDIKTDKRLQNLNAVVFLGIKPKGRAKKSHTPIKQENFNKLVGYCNANNIPYGFDSCSASKFAYSFLHSNLSTSTKNHLLSMTESCESELFSAYIDVHGRFWPCSFAVNEPGILPIDVTKADNFTADVWNNQATRRFREKLLTSAEGDIRKCIFFNL